MVAKDSLYLYAIVSNDQPYSLGPCGISGEEVYAIGQGDVAAIVSKFALKKIRPERRHLSAHNQVHRELNNLTSPIPVSFGIISDDANKVKKILTLNQKPLVEKLNQIHDTMEMGLKVIWNVPDIFSYFVDQYPELKQARDKVFLDNANHNRDEKIALGRIFDQLLNDNRAQHTQTVEEVLKEYVEDVRHLNCRDEKLVMNLALLVSKHREKEFETGIFNAAAKFDDYYSFDYKGPFVPYNFVEMEIDF
ncbi:MAG: GvpL/GvpF family gas vesicle protein [Proteobacteria bacterium]|nr:GvpL/GvpF family gas vesicle protein [Pseudomonadota bacterium]